MKLEHRSIECYGSTTAEALASATKKLHEEYNSDGGCQVTMWYGIDAKTAMPVCRITYLKFLK